MERRTFLTSTGAIGASGLLSSLLPKTARGASSVNDLFSGKNNSLRGNPGTKSFGILSEDLSPYTGPWGETQLRHLLRRCMFGVPESQFQSALKTAPFGADATVPMNAIVTELLACQDANAVPLPVLSITPPNLAPWLETIPAGNPNLLSMEVQEIVNWWFDLMMQEKLSIRQKMTLMWTNHFVTGSSTVIVSAYVYQYLITCMTNALGNFKTFAQAISTDPAMLVYLNGDQNYFTAKNNNVNENYAREVMELFTLGINFPGTDTPNYTQNDVEANAQALTGWTPTITYPFQGSFNSKRFDPNQKTFLGQTGNWALQDIINIIFQQPTTSPQYPPGITSSDYPEGYTAAYWACQTIYKEFVYYNPAVTDPNGTVIDAMARLMLNPPSPYNPFDIAPVMQALLTSAHFYSDEVIGAQIKSPCEYMGSIVREFGLTYTPFIPADPSPTGKTDGNGNPTYTDSNPEISVLTNQIMNASQGQQLLNPPNVAGWPGGENWLSAGTFQGRQTYTAALLGTTSGYKGISAFNPSSYMNEIPNVTNTTTEAELFPQLEDASLAFTLVPLNSGGIEAGELEKDPTLNVANDLVDAIPAFALTLATLPEFQLY